MLDKKTIMLGVGTVGTLGLYGLFLLKTCKIVKESVAKNKEFDEAMENAKAVYGEGLEVTEVLPKEVKTNEESN